MTGPGVVSSQRRHRRAARSPVEDMTFCAPCRVNICVASLQEQLGIETKDAVFRWLTREQFGMTFLDQLGFMDMKGLGDRCKYFLRVCGLNFGYERVS